MLALTYFTFRDLLHDRWRSLLTILTLAAVVVGYLLLAALAQTMASLSKRAPITNNLLIIETTSNAPKGAVFDEFARFNREVVVRMGASVAVAEGGGFRLAMVRGVAAGLALVLPTKVPYTFVETVEQGAAVLAPKLSPASGGVPGLLRAVRALRAHLGRPA